MIVREWRALRRWTFPRNNVLADALFPQTPL
jgi:hypothetical protein